MSDEGSSQTLNILTVNNFSFLSKKNYKNNDVVIKKVNLRYVILYLPQGDMIFLMIIMLFPTTLHNNYTMFTLQF